MKLPYATKYNGIWYNAGEEIPVPETKVEEKVETPVKDEKPIEETVVEERPKKVAVKKNKK